jgi:hypothetical protein
MQFEAKPPSIYKKRAGMETIPKKYKANKSTRTHVVKEHNNEDTTNKIEEP